MRHLVSRKRDPEGALLRRVRQLCKVSLHSYRPLYVAGYSAYFTFTPDALSSPVRSISLW
jgi:hypothetical protein